MKIKEQAASYLAKRKRYTYEEYLNLPDDCKRYEVINGELIMVAAPYTIHQTVSGNLEYELRTFVKNHKLGRIFDAPTDVVLDKTNVVQPDILFIARDRLNIITEKNINGAPDLVIEILSSSTAYYDLIEKKEIYEQFGVKEYWIVDPKKQRVDVFQNIKQRFELKQRLESKGFVESIIIKGFKISLEIIFSME
ncbi:Uma2 family endonuclease [candidate division KSB1 bacterium]|nr:Uma2 family endonuclease [candidate division KSB1 bacterium]MBL7094853.1 Uma2 family endonuclease [candidate division KSB1 bacterium]